MKASRRHNRRFAAFLAAAVMITGIPQQMVMADELTTDILIQEELSDQEIPEEADLLVNEEEAIQEPARLADEAEVIKEPARLADEAEAVKEPDQLIDEEEVKAGQDQPAVENTEEVYEPDREAAEDNTEESIPYSHKYTRNALLKDGTGLPGVYFASAKKGDNKSTATLGIPSIAKQNLEGVPTTESPAIIQGGAVPYERRVSVSNRIEFEKISNEPICAPYSKFRYKIIEEADANGNGTHQKISGFDGTYVIVRVDVSDLIKDAPAGSFLHAQVSENKAMLTAVGLEEIKTGDKVSGVSFTDNTGTRAACYSLSDNAIVLKDKDGKYTETPYVDVIMMASGTIVAGADKGTANAVNADFPVSFYVDQTSDYDPSIEWNPETNQVINAETREVVADKTDSQGKVIKTAQAMLLDKYYNEAKAKEAGLGDSEFTSYKVKGDDLELEVMVDETKDDASTERQYWSLRKAMDYQRYNKHTIRLMCEVPVLEGLLLEDTQGSPDREVVLDVNSFDIQIANHAETNAAGLTVKRATLTLKDGSNTTGAELAVGNNASMEISDNGKLVIDRTCQVEVEYDAASTAAGEQAPADAVKLDNGVITVNKGGEIVNNGIITVEGKEGKAAGADAATIVRDYKDACLTIGEGGTLTNNGCLLVNGLLFNFGTIVNNGYYKDTIVSSDPDKGTFTYHRGIQLSWKDDVTQGNTNGGMLLNGHDDNGKHKDAYFENNGDLVLIPGYIYNDAKIKNTGSIFMTSVDEVIRPITATQDAPTVTEERVMLGYPENSYFYNYESGIVENTGSIRTADFEITSNGRTGDLKSEVNPYFEKLEILDFGGKIVNSANGVIALNRITSAGELINSDNAGFKGTYATEKGSKEVVTKLRLWSLEKTQGSFTDSSSGKGADVYGGARSVSANGAEKWEFVRLKSISVTPASASVGSGDSVEWTIKTVPETEGEGIKYNVIISGDDMDDEELTVPADGGLKKMSPAAPAKRVNLIYDFYPQYDGNGSAYARAAIRANDGASYKLGVVRPTAMQDLVYNGEEQLLITEGYASEGIIQYKVGDGDFSTKRPRAKNAGDYAVSYRFVKSAEDATVLDEGGTINVSIAKRPLYLAADDKGSKKGDPLKELTYVAYGLIDADKYSLGIELKTTANEGSEVGSYPITLSVNEANAGNYEFKDADGKTRLSDGKYYITEKYINMSVSSNLTGYRNMNEGLGGTVKYKRDESKTTETLCKVYYSDKKELNKDNYKTDGVISLTYAAVGTDKVVYYYVEEAGISGSQRVVIIKADQKAPGIKDKDQGGVLEVESGYGSFITGLAPREMEYRRSDSDTYKKAIYESQRVSAGTYYVRRIGNEHYNSGPDTEIAVPDKGKAPVTVSFNAAGGKIKSQDYMTVQVEYGDTVSEPVEIPVREGKTFKGWLEDDVPYDFTRPVRYDIELKADWDVVKYTVSFDMGRDVIVKEKYEAGQKVEKSKDPERTGYVFNGWKNEDGSAYDFDLPVMKDFTLVADFEPISYRIAFDANGGSGSMDPMTVSYDEAKSLSVNSFTRDDYVFAGWNDKADGSGRSYTDGQAVKNLTETAGETVTLYAKWKKALSHSDIIVTVDRADEIVYTGKEIRPNVVVKDKSTDTDITRLCRFTYSDNINAGEATIGISVLGSVGGYAGTRTEKFTIGKGKAGTSFGELTRSYLRTDKGLQVFDLTRYLNKLPADRGETVFTVSANGAVPFTVKPEVEYVSGNKVLLLRYDLAGSDKTCEGKIVVTARMHNYEDSELTVNVRLEEYAIYLQEGREYVPLEDDLITGKSYSLVLRTPSGIVKKGVTYESSDTVSAPVAKSGKLNAKKACKVTVRLSYEEVVLEHDITINPAVKNIELSKKSYSMGTGESVTIKAAALPKDAGQMVMWSVNKADLAETVVNDDGSITLKAVKKGTLKLTAQALDGSKKKANCSISIGDPVTAFTITAKGNKPVLASGKKLNMTVKWEGKPKNKNLVWKVTDTDGISDASDIAVISQKGVLTGKSEGKVRVTATSVSNPSKSAYCEINVYVPVKKIALTATKGTVTAQKGMELGVTVTSVTEGVKATGERLGSEPSVEYTVDKKYADSLIILKKGNSAVIKAAEGAAARKNIPVKVTVRACNGYSKTLTCKVTITDAR